MSDKINNGGPAANMSLRDHFAGLAMQALSMDSQAFALELGHKRWLLLPDRQALEAVRGGRGDAQQRDLPGGGLKGVWLGFRPRPREQEAIGTLAKGPVWLSGAMARPRGLPPGWRATGPSGYLAFPGGWPG